MSHRSVNLAIAAASVVLGCTSARIPALEKWRAELGPDALNLLRPSVVYTWQDVIQSDAGVPFVASLRTLPGSTADSTRVMLTLSLANRDLTFERVGSGYEAIYVVEASFRAGADEYPSRGSELVRVTNPRETQTAGETVIYRRDLGLPPDIYEVTIRLRDVNRREIGRARDSLDVPAYVEPQLVTPIPLFTAGTRDDSRAALPGVVNPRGWYRFGLDSIFLYLEAYRLQEPRNVSVQVRTRGGAVLWEDSVAFGGRQEVEGITILIPDSVPAFGWTEVVATLPGKLPRLVPIFVTVSDRWPIASLDALDTMLTFFGPEADGFLQAPAAERRERWRTFWTTTDDLKTVGVNETLDRFFMAIDSANAHFAEPSIPGWLTDRGEVILSIGLPEFIVDDGPIAVASGSGPLLWEYPNLGVTLSFVRGRQGTLRWSLHPRSEVDFRRAVRRYRELYGNRRPWLHQGILGETSQHTDPGR